MKVIPVIISIGCIACFGNLAVSIGRLVEDRRLENIEKALAESDAASAAAFATVNRDFQRQEQINQRIADALDALAGVPGVSTRHLRNEGGL